MQTLNNYFLKRAVLVYFLSLISCSVLFSSHIMQWYSLISGVCGILFFYYFSVTWEQRWKRRDERAFERILFISTLIVRFSWIFLYNLFTNTVWGTPWEQPIGVSMDSVAYFYEAEWARELFRTGLSSEYFDYIGHNYADAGYPLLLILFNSISKSNILFSRIPNAFFDAFTALLVYRLAKRNFGEESARLASIFVVWMPMLIFYSGVTMKETVMLMLTTWALERGDMVIKSRHINLGNLAVFFVIALSVALFRTALSWVLILAFVSALLLTSNRVISASNRITILIAIVAGILIVLGGTILQTIEEFTIQYHMGDNNFVHRSRVNSLVGSMSKATLFPLLLTIPFPTMVDIPDQYIQQIQNGGFFLKNIFSFFCVFAVVILFIKKQWRDHTLILAYLFGYLVVLGLSSFAHSGRFHHPVLVVELVLAAYGINSVTNIKQARLFSYFLAFEYAIVIGWNWFKLRGRGLS